MNSHPDEPPPGPALECDGLRRSFGTTQALNGFTMSLPPGEVIALVGPNGSGKTTLLLILSGLLAPDGGSARVGGFNPVHRPFEVHSFRAHRGPSDAPLLRPVRRGRLRRRDRPIDVRLSDAVHAVSHLPCRAVAHIDLGQCGTRPGHACGPAGDVAQTARDFRCEVRIGDAGCPRVPCGVDTDDVVDHGRGSSRAGSGHGGLRGAGADVRRAACGRTRDLGLPQASGAERGHVLRGRFSSDDRNTDPVRSRRDNCPDRGRRVWGGRGRLGIGGAGHRVALGHPRPESVRRACRRRSALEFSVRARPPRGDEGCGPGVSQAAGGPGGVRTTRAAAPVARGIAIELALASAAGYFTVSRLRIPARMLAPGQRVA